MTTKLKYGLTALAMAACGFTLWYILTPDRESTDPAAAEGAITSNLAKASEPAVPVEVDTAKTGDLVVRLSTTGRTRALRAITIAPKVGGQVVDLPVAEGQHVRKGELLLKLDDRQAKLALAEAKDRLLGRQVQFGLLLREEKRNVLQAERGSMGVAPESRVSEAAPGAGNSSTFANKTAGGFASAATPDDVVRLREKLRRAKQRHQRGEITADELSRIELEYVMAEVFSGEKREALMAHQSGYTEAKLAVERAELELSQTEIRAPFAGTIADLQVADGQQVSAGQQAMKLLDLSEIEVALHVLESEIGSVAVGRQVELTFPALPGESYHGRVNHINPIVDETSRTTRVSVRLANPDRRILPGMFTYAKLEAQVYPDRLLVPRDAILVRDQRKLLFIVREGLAKWCYVETGQENETQVEIVSSTFGLKPGELVITGGHYTLVHDARVKF